MTKYFFIFAILLIASPVLASEIDTDKDGLTDEEEKYYYTDPMNPDTDGDGYWDGVEIDFDYSPHLGDGKKFHENDFDGDGLNDWIERWFKSDIGKEDTDGDGYTDFDEVMSGYGPVNVAATSTFDREIIVDRTLQRLYYFVDNIKILNLPVSTGNPETETPDGEFIIERMIDMKSYVGEDYDLPNVWWNMQFKPMYYIHAAYWHNDFGRRTHSHGCVNMKYEDAEIIYKHMDIGVPVSVTGTTPSKYWVES